MTSHTIIAGVVICASVCAPPQQIKVWDGDTFRFGTETVRILNIDAPEIKGRCDAERRQALAAKLKLSQLLDNAGRVSIERSKRRDPYRRTLALVRVDGRDVEWLDEPGF